MRILKCTLLLFIAIALSQTLSGATIFFDLNGVLVTQSGAWWEIGPLNFIGFYNFSHIQRKYFEFLESIEQRQSNATPVKNGDTLLPQVICEWLVGNYTSAQVLEKIEQKLAQKTITKRYRSLFKAIAQYMFTPHRFAKTIVPIKSGKKLFQKCRDAKNSDGSFKHKIYLISNWDTESFPYLLHNSEIRNIIMQADGVMISGTSGLLKPNPSIYLKAFEQFNVDPDHELTLYIDDEKINIEAARSLGKKKLFCLHCKNGHFSPIKKAFKQLQIV